MKTIAMVQSLSLSHSAGIKDLLRKDKGGDTLCLVYDHGELVHSCFVNFDYLSQVKNRGFYGEAIAPESAGDLLKVFWGVDELVKCKNAEVLIECDQAFAEIGSDFKQKVWNATFGSIRTKISQIKLV